MKQLNKEQQDIVIQNERLIYFAAKTYHLDIDEFYDLLAIGLCKAAMFWNPSGEGKFSTYALTVMRNECYMYLRGQSKCPPSELITSYELVSKFDEDGNRLNILNFIPGDSDVWDKIVYINTDTISDTEQELLEMSLAGYTQTEIREKLNITQSYVCKKLKRIYNKLEGVA